MKIPLFSFDENFDAIKHAQDEQAFRDWAVDIRNDEDQHVKTCDAVLGELSYCTIQRALARMLPESEGYTWRVTFDSGGALTGGATLYVKSPKGFEVKFSDVSFGIIFFRLERTNWDELQPPAPPPAPFKPFRIADVAADDPFERARAEIAARRAMPA